MLHRSFIFLTGLLGLAASCSAGPQSSDQSLRSDDLKVALQDETLPKVLVVAHRACWLGGAPENSLEAISECIAMGADMIEIDVNLTADGVPVLFHDLTLDRTTNGTGSLATTTYAEVRKLHLKSGAGGSESEVTSRKIPTLEEALLLSKGKILINLDVKSSAFDEAYQVVERLDVEDQILMKMNALPDDPALQSARFMGRTFFMPIIRECNEINDHKSCSPTLSDVVPGYDAFWPVAYELTFTDLDYFAEGVDVMRAHGGRIWVNTLEPRHAAGITDAIAKKDPDATWGLLIELGTNMIQTDRPAELIKYLEKRNLR